MRVGIVDVVAVFVGSRESVLKKMDNEHSWRRGKALLYVSSGEKHQDCASTSNLAVADNRAKRIGILRTSGSRHGKYRRRRRTAARVKCGLYHLVLELI